jgi:hypothetical protein
MGAVRAALADRQAVLPPEARDIALNVCRQGSGPKGLSGRGPAGTALGPHAPALKPLASGASAGHRLADADRTARRR